MQDQMAAGVTTEMSGVQQSVGRHLGYAPWREVTQEQMDRFARITGDHNFIHVDAERARQTPVGGTIAHGFLTLARVAEATHRLDVSDAATSINHGLEKRPAAVAECLIRFYA